MPKRSKKYEPKITLKEGVEFGDLIDLSINKKDRGAKSKPKNKAAPKKKKTKK